MYEKNNTNHQELRIIKLPKTFFYGVPLKGNVAS